jgi:hypothetical protein
VKSKLTLVKKEDDFSEIQVEIGDIQVDIDEIQVGIGNMHIERFNAS